MPPKKMAKKKIAEEAKAMGHTIAEHIQTEEGKRKSMKGKKKEEKHIEEVKKEAKEIIPPKMRKVRKDKGTTRTPQDKTSGQGFQPPPSTY